MRWRHAAVVGLDLVAWILAIAFTALVEEWRLTDQRVLWLMLAAPLAQLATGYAIGLYRRWYRPLSFEELGALGLSVGVAGFGILAVDRMLGPEQFGHRCVWATATAMALTLAHRYARQIRARVMMAQRMHGRIPVVVAGAGEGGDRALKAMQVHDSPYRAVALVDDDPSKARMRVRGIKVEGGLDALADVARRHHATAVVVAIPSARPALLRSINARATAAGLQTLVMPPVQQLFGQGSTAEIRPYTDEEVLRRQLVDVDLDAVRALVAGASVLVTGAGGSIGSELSRQLARLGPSTLVLLDHDDSLLHDVQRSITLAMSPVTVCSELADVRDAQRLEEVFAQHRPQVVFHAAALKHVPALEAHPAEGWKTNVEGTRNVLSAAEQAGVARVVNISTDKAADPVNVLGTTKRIAEQLTAESGVRLGRPWVSVRFGNVIGSRGSVIETFQAQIAAGGPITVTHPDVTRYFMAVREAVLLTLQAAAIGEAGEVLVLDMGEPVRIVDLAQQLVEQAGGHVDIVFTGLRPGEKLHEVLLAPGEVSQRRVHPMISHVLVQPTDAALDL